LTHNQGVPGSSPGGTTAAKALASAKAFLFLEGFVQCIYMGNVCSAKEFVKKCVDKAGDLGQLRFV
tara:strand:+ start:275 stop:472 length:198 start_codon:yes stop_codon:yes gene_type:complete